MFYLFINISERTLEFAAVIVKEDPEEINAVKEEYEEQDPLRTEGK